MKTKMKSIIRFFRVFSKETAHENIRTHASSAAFFIFLSLIPFLLLLILMIPFTPLTKADLLAAIVYFLPNAIDGYAINILDQLYQNSLTLLSVSAIAAIWSSAQGFLSLTNGLNAIYHVKEDRNYFLLRFRAACYTVIFMLLLLVSVMLACFGRSIQNILEEYLPRVPKSITMILDCRILLSALILVFLFTFLYTYLPNRKQKVKYQLPGAIISSFGWSGFSWIFSFYTSKIHKFDMYGSLSTIIILLLWLYICMYILFICAKFNVYLERNKRPSIDKIIE